MDQSELEPGPLDHIFDPCASRTVKPRKPTEPTTREIIAIDPRVKFIVTDTGESTFEEYAHTLWFAEPHIVVCYSPEVWLLRLHQLWRTVPVWSWRVATTDAHGNTLQHKRVAYWGFRSPNKKAGTFHVIIDAQSFVRKAHKDIYELHAFGHAVRDFCNDFGLTVRASAAGIASQLLRHPDFYPELRRRVPHFINEQVRPHLPGGHYHAGYAEGVQKIHAALYIDQESAHHYAAETTPLPSSNSVRKIGYTGERTYARSDGELYRREIQKLGLVKARVTIPRLTKKQTEFTPALMHEAGEKIAHLWTNEIQFLESFGLQIHGIMAIWGTDEVDTGIKRYAQWAKEVQRTYPQFKALLLMPYGLLARRRADVEFHHPGGDSRLVLANQVVDDTRSWPVQTHPETANALQLGLIQSFVRSLSLDMARQLTEHGSEVISIYSDGIFVKLAPGETTVPLFAPWREKGEVELEISDTLKVPVRRKVTREYMSTRKITGANNG